MQLHRYYHTRTIINLRRVVSLNVRFHPDLNASDVNAPRKKLHFHLFMKVWFFCYYPLCSWKPEENNSVHTEASMLMSSQQKIATQVQNTVGKSKRTLCSPVKCK